MRPPNLLTALADIVAGFTAAAALQHTLGYEFVGLLSHDLPWRNFCLIGASSMSLYAGGVVLNDFFDADIDQLERPERPIPSGKVTRSHAAMLGGLLLVFGIALASAASFKSGMIAFIVGLLVVFYDAFGKKNPLLGPLSMGLCRGGNLLLGISIFPQQIVPLGFLITLPVIYITAVTLISRGEVHGTSRHAFNLSLLMYLLSVLMVGSLGLLKEFSLLLSGPFIALLCLIIFPPLINAKKSNDPSMIGKAVKNGVLGLIILDAAIASGFAGWFFGLLLLILLAFSTLLAKVFAVT